MGGGAGVALPFVFRLHRCEPKQLVFCKTNAIRLICRDILRRLIDLQSDRVFMICA